MATLSIRNLPDDVHQRLRLRAASNCRSMEAEAREVLAKACGPTDAAAVRDIQDFVDRLYKGRKPRNVAASLIRERRREARQE
ncbi:MAG: plasmid stabilization protein [Alphaproteobacteria bacterium]|nr:plasmid stabilization protein [Alphaproteobacteria bacterium]